MRKTSKPLLILAAVLALGARASQDQNYGLGGTTTGRVGSTTAETENPFAALLNPALLAAHRTPQLTLTVATVQTRWAGLGDVLLDSPRYRMQRGTPRTGPFEPPRTATALWVAGMGLPFRLGGSDGRRAGVGFVLSGPFDRLRTFRSQTPYDFQTLRYGTADAQFKGTLSGALELLRDSLFFGAGVSLYITTAGTAEAVLRADNPTARFAADVGLNSTGLAGLFARLGRSQWSLVYRQAIAPSFVQKFSGTVGIAGEDTLHQPVTFRSTLYYEPHTLETDWQRELGPIVVGAGVAWQFWSAYQPASLVTEALDARGETRTTQLPKVPMVNTLNPRASVEVPLFARRASLALGYAFRPSPVRDLSGAANLLDTDTHVLGASFGHRLELEGLPPLTWSVFGQYHHLSRRAVTKRDSAFIGAPGYTISGSTHTLGLSLRAEL